MAMVRTLRAGKLKNSQCGFTYTLALVAVAVTMLAATVGISATSQLVKREREKELLFRGLAYRNAIKSYYEAGNPVKVYPRSLDELLKDPRFASGKRHLRKPYADPMAKEDSGWTLIKAADGGIMGVASASQEKPLKTANFPRGLESLQGGQRYASWIFRYTPPPAAPPARGLPARPAPPL